MSTSYQTNAKPRGRRGSYSESSEKQSNSRASSSASVRLSKTLSRHLDEVSAPRNSRPSSPAVHNHSHRHRNLDLRSSDPCVNSRGQTPERRSRSKTQSGLSYTSDKDAHPSTATAASVASPEPHRSASFSVLGNSNGLSDPKSRSPESMNVPQGLTRNTRSFKSLASMQPTVTEEAEEHIGQRNSMTPQPSLQSPTIVPSPAPPKVSDMLPPRDIPMPFSPVTAKSSPQVLPGFDPRTSDTSLDELLLAAPAPKAPVPFISQPVISSDEEGAPVTIVPSLAGGWEQPQTYEQTPIQSYTPLASPPQSPMLHQYMGSPPLQAVPYMHPFPYPPPLMPNPTYSPGFYPTQFAPPPPPMPNFQTDMIPRSGSAGAEDERTRLLEKVSNVLPDINRLLHHYQETQGLLSEKENLVRQAETHHVEEVAKLQVELTVTKEEFEKLLGELATENVRLKGELADQAEKLARVEENSVRSARIREELEEHKLKYKEIEAECQQGRSVVENLMLEKVALRAEVEEYKKHLEANELRHEDQMEELRQNLEEQFRKRDEAYNKTASEQKTGLSKIQLDLAGMITKHSIQKKDLDSVRSLLSEQEKVAASRTKELAETRQMHKEELEARDQQEQEQDARHKHEVALWSKKMAEGIVRREEMIHEIRTSMEAQIEQEKKTAESRIASLTEKFSGEENRLSTALDASKALVEQLKEEMGKEREAHNALKSLHLEEKVAHNALQLQYNAASQHHSQLTDTMLVLKSKQAEWHQQSEKMDRILQSLGQLGSGKSGVGGDEYFVSAFDQLASSVEAISKQFLHDDLGGRAFTRNEFETSGLPDLMGQSECARGLRGLVMQSQIFRILQQRIFEPFLFVTAYDGDDNYGVDHCLAMIARLIRAKSVNRERIWRSMTMRAVYGSPYGRKAAVAAAGRISEEIMERLQTMAHPTNYDMLLRAVRLVVKTAIQLWRRSRLEWDWISSTMPPVPDRKRETDTMLWVRPHVARERIMGSVDGEESNQHGAYVYLQGTGIREDSPLVTARRQELLAGVGG
ncbi:hypothetical protein LTR84_004549 [Exophiala bonariae]|uniref:Uncharacterized protein n=1 Tax=Exophiala bonariae TaxID=1690606 RepID=A0AAV9NPN1_9EURO|nr:hypothetical protein LTR84_004549 [Exophiala bonariae]